MPGFCKKPNMQTSPSTLILFTAASPTPKRKSAPLDLETLYDPGHGVPGLAARQRRLDYSELRAFNILLLEILDNYYSASGSFTVQGKGLGTAAHWHSRCCFYSVGGRSCTISSCPVLLGSASGSTGELESANLQVGLLEALDHKTETPDQACLLHRRTLAFNFSAGSKLAFVFQRGCW